MIQNTLLFNQEYGYRWLLGCLEGLWGKKKPRKFKEKNVTLSAHFLNQMKAIASVNCFEKKISSRFKAI